MTANAHTEIAPIPQWKEFSQSWAKAMNQQAELQKEFKDWKSKLLPRLQEAPPLVRPMLALDVMYNESTPFMALAVATKDDIATALTEAMHSVGITPEQVKETNATIRARAKSGNKRGRGA